MTNRAAEWQLIRPDGTVLASFVFPEGHYFSWCPPYGQEIRGTCASRQRVLPAGPWVPEFWYPSGFPGEPYPWPPDPTGTLVVVLDDWVTA